MQAADAWQAMQAADAWQPTHRGQQNQGHLNLYSMPCVHGMESHHLHGRLDACMSQATAPWFLDTSVNICRPGSGVHMGCAAPTSTRQA